MDYVTYTYNPELEELQKRGQDLFPLTDEEKAILRSSDNTNMKMAILNSKSLAATEEFNGDFDSVWELIESGKGYYHIREEMNEWLDNNYYRIEPPEKEKIPYHAYYNLDKSSSVLADMDPVLSDNSESILGVDPEDAPDEIGVIPTTKEQGTRQAVNAAFALGTAEDTLDLDVSEALDNIANKGDSAYRAAVEQYDVQESIQLVQEKINSGDTDPFSLQQSIDLVDQVLNEKDEFRLEKKAVDKALEFQRNNPGWADLRLLNKPLLETVADNAKKDQVIKTLLDNKRITEKGEGFFGYFLDGAGEIALEFIFDNLVSYLRTYGLDAAQILREAKAIRDLPIEEIPAAFEALHQDLKDKSSMVPYATTQRRALRNLEIGFEGTDSDLGTEGAWAAAELILALPYVASVAKGGMGLLKATGNSSTAAREVTRAMKNGTTDGTLVESSSDLVREASVFQPTGPDFSGISDAVARELKVTEDALRELMESPSVHRLTPDELQTAVRARENKLRNLHGDERLTTGEVRFNSNTGMFEFDMYLGKRDGAGFASERSAKGWLSKSSVEGEVVETPNGWMIKQTQAVSESLADDGFRQVKPIGLARRILSGPKAFVDSFLGAHGTAASHRHTRSSEVVKQLYRKNIESLGKKEFNEINTILDDVLREDKRIWYTNDQLNEEFLKRFGKSASEDQILAYNTYRQLSDYAYYLDNKAIYQKKALKGLQKITLNDMNVPSFEGTVLTSMKEVTKVPGRERVFNQATGTIERVTPEQLEKAFNNGYVLIRPSETEWTIDAFGEGASYLLVKKNKNLKIGELDFQQLQYVAGGRREYSSPFFIGQQTSGSFSDGTRYLNAPRMFRTATTEKEALRWVDNANTANRLLREVEQGAMDVAEASARIEAATGKTYNEWKTMAEAEGWDLSQPFKSKRNREDFVPDFDAQDALRMYDPDSFAAQFGVSRPGRLGSRGDVHLKDVGEEAAPVYDALTSLRRNVDAAINAGMYSDFASTAINRFNTTFRKYILDAEKLSPYEVVTRGVVDDRLLKAGTQDGVDMAKLYNSIKAHQYYIKSMLRVQGDWDIAVRNSMDKLARWVDKGTLGHKASAALSRSQGDPISFMRNLNFDLNMSFFNPAQFLMQANSIVIALGLSPKHGLAAFKDIAPLRMALISGDPLTTRGISKHFSKLTEGTDIEKAADQFRRLGFNDFGSNLSMIDSQVSLGATSNRMMSKVNRFREQSRFFFQEGERYSRITAYGIARRKYSEKFPTKDVYSKQADNWIREETDRLLMSPNADNNALLNKGLGGIPTQFWSYMMKVSDATFTGAGGRYSWRERGQVMIAQMLFYGTAGMPFLDYMVDSYEKSTGTVLDPVKAKAIHNGLIDTLLFVSSGGEINTDFSGISGLGGWWSSLLENLAENPIPQLLGGATGSNLAGAAKVMDRTAQVYGLSHSPNMEGVGMTALAGVGSLFKSVDKATKAWLAYNTGIWFDKYGNAVSEVSKGEAIASIWGLPPQAVSDTYQMSIDSKNAHQKYIKDITPIIEGMHLRHLQAETEQERDAIQQQLNALWSVVHQSGYGSEVAQSVNMYRRSPTFQKKLMQQLQKEALRDRKGQNFNYLSKEFREELIKLKDSE